MERSQDKIEILPVDLLDRHRPQVEALKALAPKLALQFGWHYLLDLSWILENIGDPHGLQVMDAGAGFGILQWYLVEQGVKQVISVDRVDRTELPLSLRVRYRVRGMHPSDIKPPTAMIAKNVRHASGAGKFTALVRGVGSLFLIPLPKAFPGRLVFYNQDLADLQDIPDDSLDAVVAVSALEHNTPEALEGVVAAIMCKLRPGGRLVATLGAARDKDWFHEPSRGWNYTDATLRRIFNLTTDTPSNYARYDELFTSLKNCAELRDNLAPFYSLSGENGMPWGKWDPQYQPVGVCKVKPIPGQAQA